MEEEEGKESLIEIEKQREEKKRKATDNCQKFKQKKPALTLMVVGLPLSSA